MSAGGAQKVVVIGAGIVGNSVAYHLTRLGVTDITLVDKGPLPNPGRLDRAMPRTSSSRSTTPRR